tara:strand:+ start:188 stop:586 length:399 start_codon:yes stop_codon:yes gene_type:complete
MKKGPFKMKGFSGFGVSPAKNVLDTKIGDIPKKAKKAIKTGIDKFKNTTIRDVMRINPVYRAFDNRRRTKNISEAFFEGAAGGAAEVLGNRGLMSQKMSKTRMPEINMKTIPRKNLKKLPAKPKMRFNQFTY